ncbi:MAG: maleylacetoacetate isomerase [Desulforhopalus sp.]
MLQLYSYFRSSAAYRVRIALNHKGVDYQQHPVNLVMGEQNTPDYLSINPQGLVPALKLADDTIITQSTAILEWLEEQYPEPSLYPHDPIIRAQGRSLCNIIACDIHPLNNLRVLKYLMDEFHISEEQKINWYQNWIAQGFSSLEKALSPEPFALGCKISMVDVYLVPQVYNALRFKQDMNDYPNINRIYHACNELEPFKRAAPESQIDAP